MTSRDVEEPFNHLNHQNMSYLRSLLKRAGITAPKLAEASGLTVRTISHHFNTGRMPYTILYKLHLATGLSMEEIVPKHVAEYWLSLWNESEKTNKPRGKKKQNAWGTPPKPNEMTAAESLPEKVRKKALMEDSIPPALKQYPLTEDDLVPTDILKPKKARVPRETHEKPELGTVPTIPAPAKHKKPSVADLMKSKPAPPPEEEGAPDFSNVPDDIFATSADQVPVKKKR